MLNRTFLFILFSFIATISIGQDYYIIKEIKLEGNKKTKDNVIFRELDITIGDTIYIDNSTTTNPTLERNRQRILGTTLFNDVTLSLSNDKTFKTLTITVKEDWYWYPIPLLELADRNFNVWWVEQNRALNRLNYGMYFIHKNLTGNRDELKVVGLSGYTQKATITYKYPYLNQAQTLGLTFDFLYARNKEIPYKTDADKLQFYRDEDNFMLKRFRLGAGVQYRPKIKWIHNASLFFHNNQIDDYALTLNDSFFKTNENNQSFFKLKVLSEYENRDFRPYPMRGNYSTISVTKEGLGIYDDLNSLYLTTEYRHYIPISKRFSTEWIARGRVSFLDSPIPYYNAVALGYEDVFLRGYEYYVVDGQNYYYGKASLRFLAFEHTFDLSKFVPINTFKICPVKLFLVLNADTGYVQTNQVYGRNDFPNRQLRSFGIGIDYLFYQTRLIEFEYSINHTGEGAFYLHTDFFF